MGDTSAISRFAGDRYEFASGSSGRIDPARPAPDQAGRYAAPVGDRPSDRVEISERARLVGKMKQLPAVREDLICQIRQVIARGQYESSDKLDEAISNLSSELDLWA